MGTIHENARRHLADKRQTLKKIDVPEWASEVFYYPWQNFEEMAALQETLDPRLILTGGYSPESFLAVLKWRARNSEGVRIFTDGDVEVMRKEYDPEVIERVAVAIIDGTEKSSASAVAAEEEAKKK